MPKKAKNSLQKRNNHTAYTRHAVRQKSDKARQKRALESMVRDLGYDTKGVHIRDIYLPPKAPLRPMNERAVGVFSSSERGFGFVRVEGRERDIFIPAAATAGAISGDTVDVRYRTYLSGEEEKTEGCILRITQPLRTLIGRVAVIEDTSFGKRRTVRRYALLPDDRRIRLTPYIDDLCGARVGDKVALKLSRNTSSYISGRVTRVYGPSDKKASNDAAIVDACGIETDFSPDVLQRAEQAAARPIDHQNRKDFRRQTVFTIDGADAKDLDDALAVRRLPDGAFLLYVHIADVSYYVEERTALDRAAMRRGSSVYFADRVIPMLPPVLSNGVCSLHAGEDRAVLSACLHIKSSGEILSVRICPAVIRSRLRGVYSEANDVLDQGERSPYYKKYKPVLPALSALCELYRIRKAYTQARGAIELESSEAVILMNEAGEPCDIRPRQRGLSEQIIEQCMLAAGEGVAQYMRHRGIPCVYRTHQKPPEAQMRELLPYLQSLGLDIRGIDPAAVTQQHIRRLLADADARGLSLPVGYRVLRSMAKATYQSSPFPHFGIAAPVYCHFTSPIRRLGDLAVHRLLRRVAMDGVSGQTYAAYADRAARAASDGELRATEAERRMDELYKALYMKNFIGTVFDAVITSVAACGLFCTPQNTCTGLVPTESLGGVYIFDEPTLTLRSHTHAYRIGDTIRVRLTHVDVGAGKWQFCVSEDEPTMPKQR